MSNIHAALNAAMRDVAKIGIAKTKTADTGMAKYQFRGVEQAMNELSPILVNNGITVTPRYSDLTIQERTKGDPKDGKATRFVTLKGSFVFTALDGSHVTSEAYGEAMDSGDKAVIKAQSVSFRTALFQLFVVPTMSMDTELDDYEEGEDQRLAGFRAAAMSGTQALRAHYDANTPDEAFWKKHSASLKAAAAEVDRGSRQ